MKKTKESKQYIIQHSCFFPQHQSEVTEVLPPGSYTTELDRNGAPFLKPFTIKNDVIVHIKDSVTEEVVSEVRKFWSDGVSEKFKQYGLIQKRGLLLYGVAGSGKTLCVTQVAQMAMKEYGAVALFNPEPRYLVTFIETIRQIEPDKKIVVIFEEFEQVLNRAEGDMLSILDGQIQAENILYIATTNYISQIPARIKNRPSRFARIIEFVAPNEETRRQYLQQKLKETDQKHLEPMVKLTEGLVLDQLKDIIQSVCCFDLELTDAVAKVREMNSNNSIGVDDYKEQSNKNNLDRWVREMEKQMEHISGSVPGIVLLTDKFDQTEE